MRHRQIFSILFLAAFLLCLGACGSTPAVTDAATASADPFVCPHTELYETGQCKTCLNYFGKLGENIDWAFLWEDCSLTLTGSGEMTAAVTQATVLQNARTVTIGDGITSIADSAFQGGEKITAVRIPDGVTAIGNKAFYCTALTEVQLPLSLQSVGYMAFCGAPLTALTLPEGLTDIGDSAFGGAAFKEIYIPAAVRHIGAGAFDSQALLRYTVSPDNAVYSADAAGALFDRDGQTLIAYPAGKSGAYTVPEGTVRIADGAFEDCAVTAVTFLPSLVEIGANAFLNCRSLTELHTSGNIAMCDTYSFDRTPWWEAQREISLRDNTGIYLDKVLVHAYQAGEVFTVREGTEYIAAQAFIHSDCESLKTLVLPSSLRHIGDGAFSLCKNLQNVTLPEGLLTIGHAAFAHKEALTEIRIPASVTLVSTEAFLGCTSLSRVIFDGTDCEIGKDAFLYDEGATLCGAADSTAARYAAANNLPFEEIR